jgi:phage/plasmid-like protein (TIGR03299 family)
MTVLPRPTATRPVSFYDGPGYAPKQIGDWIAVTDRDHPWHTIGAALTGTGNGQSSDHVMTAAEVLTATGMDMRIEKFEVALAHNGQALPKIFVTGYDDEATGESVTFGAVSDRYEVVQPAEALSFFDQVVADIEGAAYSAAWNMREKSMMGVTITLPDEVVVDPKGANDRTSMHMLGINSLDGSTGLGGAMVGTRWFCMNQLTTSLRGTARRFSFRHTKNVRDRAAEAARAMEVAHEYTAALDKMANALYALPMGDDAFEKFLNRIPVFHIDKDASALVKTRTATRRAEVIEMAREPHNANIAGTRWGALNAVSEWAEWGRSVKGSARTGTDPERQRAIGTMVSPHVTAPVDMALEILTAMR